MLKPIGKQRVAEEIVQQLRSLILRGHYATGDKLPPERKLAEELGVNRASLREAIKALEQMGLVKTRQGDGTRVLDFMQTAGVELVSHLVAGTPDGVPSVEVLEDVLEFRRIFARDVAHMAAEKATAEDLARLEELAKRAESELTPEELLKLDFEFYLELTRTAKNRVFQLLINTVRAAVMSHAVLIAGVALVAFPLSSTFVASTLTLEQIHATITYSLAQRDEVADYLRSVSRRQQVDVSQPIPKDQAAFVQALRDRLNDARRDLASGDPPLSIAAD